MTDKHEVAGGTMNIEIAHAYDTTIEAMSLENTRLLEVLKRIRHVADKEDTVAIAVIKQTIDREVDFTGEPR